MSAHRHVDRIDLHQRNIAEELSDVPDINPIDGPWSTEPLCRESRASSLRGTQIPQKITSTHSSSVTVRL